MDRSKDLIDKFACAAYMAYIEAVAPGDRRDMRAQWEDVKRGAVGDRWRRVVKSILLTAALEPDGLNAFMIFGKLPTKLPMEPEALAKHLGVDLSELTG